MNKITLHYKGMYDLGSNPLPCNNTFPMNTKMCLHHFYILCLSDKISSFTGWDSLQYCDPNHSIHKTCCYYKKLGWSCISNYMIDTQFFSRHIWFDHMSIDGPSICFVFNWVNYLNYIIMSGVSPKFTESMIPTSNSKFLPCRKNKKINKT